MDEMNNGYAPMGDMELEKRAKNARVIAIIGLVCTLCCTYAGVALGIVAFVKANNLLKMPELPTQAQGIAKFAKIGGIVAAALSAFFIVVNIIMIATGSNEAYNQLMQMMSESGM
jgi:hypothetical protein